MEINAEINKVFGEEMAKLFASKISEEELDQACREAWAIITERPIRWRDKEPSKLDEMLRAELVNRLLSKVKEIMQETTPDEWMQQEAEQIAEEAKKKSHELIVDEIANNIKYAVFSNHSIDYAITGGLERIANAITNGRC